MTMYISTRGGDEGEKLTFNETVTAGLAKDGGLFVPETIPGVSFSELVNFRSLKYTEVAHLILRKLAGGLDSIKLWNAINEVYNSTVFCNAVDGDSASDVVPVRELRKGLYLLRLSNGPTLAFKDVALQLLGKLFEMVLAGTELNILGATSGDTGSAAIRAMLGRKGIRVFMLSPRKGMSPYQEGDMWSVNDPNIHNIAINGKFDDCQRVVKGVNADLGFKEKYHIGAVNSINWARIAAQVVYYFWAYSKIDAKGKMVDFAVPTGNFGNVESAYIAKLMGLPIRRIVLATNVNDVLHEFFETGIYRPRAVTKTTSSPSMDITAASNFERYMYHLLEGDADLVRSLYINDLAKLGHINLSGHMERISATGIVSESVDERWCHDTIRNIHNRIGIIIDPHTAVAVAAAEKRITEGVPMIALETAQPCKFDRTIERILGKVAPRPEAAVGVEERPKFFTPMDPDVEKMKQFVEKVCA